MRRKLKIAGGVIFLAAVMTGVNGCMANGTIEEQMVSYMEEKYGDVFTYVSPWGSSIGGGGIYRVLESDRYPEREVLVCCMKKDGEKIFLDSYPALEFQPLAAEQMQQACEEVWPDVQVRTEQVAALRILPEELGENPTLETYMAWQYNGDYYNIFVDIPTGAEEGKEDIERLRKALKKRNMAARMYLYYGTGIEKYNRMACLQMNEEFEYIRKEWEEG